jgi:hypothetical protein
MITDYEIEQIITEAEENPDDELFNIYTDQDLTRIKKIINRYGTIQTEVF